MTEEHDSSEDDLIAEPEEAQATAGGYLRAAREQKGFELDHIAAETRIPVRHLQAIEDGAFDELPSRAYAIGFARTYARAVGLDDGDVTDLVREELAEGHARQSALAGGMEPGDPAKLPSAGLAWFGAAAAIILAIGVFSFYQTYFGAGTTPAPLVAETEEDEAAEQLAASEDGEGTDGAGPGIDPQGKVVFTALEDGVWVRFYEDNGERFFEAQMASGDTFEVPADSEAPLINTGRPDAFAITIDGQEVPKLADEPITLGDTPISAAALLARAETGPAAPPQLN
ncbi:helix-turn-helix domain-containing protein [Erythrobacter rubeus]|uniref:Helix-turn-helix domain-containing protein n=1 Tax=Erythrobacter rubeus TaxID=2760803 RepID=A0ABR8KPZ1_9SPHN|nr:helix-turn-helix domain-containing protein [Erythrobacter rubeus]MBD2842754.1 helix-turn-helix domain-containing protein [Erythrobacter rubeus]